jgi:peptide/nickel transport system permease protein
MSAATQTGDAHAGVALGSAGQLLRREARRLPLYALLFAIGVCAVVPSLIAPHDPLVQAIADRNLAPFSHSRDGALHLLGTDPLGRDVLSRVIYGTRVSVGVAAASVAGAFLIGVPLGMLAGYFRGWVDSTIMRFVDVVLSFPILVLAIFVLYVAGPSIVNLALVLALVRWMIFARVTRGLTLEQRRRPYVVASRSIGCSDSRIIVRHIFPNILTTLLALASIEFAYVILATAGLSFLGFGVQPPNADWGLMVAEGQDYVSTAWWLVAFPGLAIFVTTVAVNALTRSTAGGAGRRSRMLGRMRRRYPAT